VAQIRQPRSILIRVFVLTPRALKRVAGRTLSLFWGILSNRNRVRWLSDGAACWMAVVRGLLDSGA
jgi:hypothetical protein